MAGALAALWLLASAAPLSYEAYLRAETQVRTPLLGEASQSPVVADLLIIPTLLLRATGKQAELVVSYEPALVLGHLTSDPTPELRQSGYLFGIWFPNRFTQMRLTGAATLGQFPFVALRGIVPGATSVEAGEFLYANAVLSAESSLGLRPLKVSADLGWTTNGPTSPPGMPLPGQVLVPSQNGPLAAVAVRGALGPRTGGSLKARANQLSFSTGQIASSLVLTTQVDHRFSPFVSMELGAGPALLRSSLRGQPPAPLEPMFAAAATVDVALPWARPGRAQSVLEARLLPYLDGLDGSAYPRAELQLKLDWRHTREARLTSELGFARAVTGGPARDHGEARVKVGYRWTFIRFVAMEASVNVSSTRHAVLGPAPLLQWFTAISLEAYQQRGRFELP
jgi:hypothetical protein